MATRTQDIIYELEAPFPTEEGSAALAIAFGAATVNISPGEHENFLEGTFEHTEGGMVPKLRRRGNTISLGFQMNEKAIMPFLRNRPGKLALELGKHQPYNLTLEGGAHKANMDFGGIPLTDLTLKTGAGKTDLDFSEKNPQQMERLVIRGGAGSYNLSNLLNANFSEMSINGGAGSFNLDFGGTLQRDASFSMRAGASSVSLAVPRQVAAIFKLQTTMGSKNVDPAMEQRHDLYYTPKALNDGDFPVLNVSIEMAMGSLNVVLV